MYVLHHFDVHPIIMLSQLFRNNVRPNCLSYTPGLRLEWGASTCPSRILNQAVPLPQTNLGVLPKARPRILVQVEFEHERRLYCEDNHTVFVFSRVRTYMVLVSSVSLYASHLSHLWSCVLLLCRRV